VTKSAGAWLLAVGVSESWMPFAAGLLFAPPLLLCVWMLTRVPAPSAEDVAARSERVPMDRGERRRFFKRYALGLTLLVLAYLLITVLRSVRADFAPEIWTGLGVTAQPEVFAESELLVAFGVVVLNGLAVLVHNHRRAFALAMGLSLCGAALIGVALAGYRAGGLGAFALMVLIGLGIYLPYVAVHTTLFERLIAMTRDRGNIGYLLYLADAFGYLGFVAVMLARNFWSAPPSFLDFFFPLGWAVAGGTFVLLALCWLYFAVHAATRRAD
jgi:Family of unknown function (DUF5690)